MPGRRLAINVRNRPKEYYPLGTVAGSDTMTALLGSRRRVLQVRRMLCRVLQFVASEPPSSCSAVHVVSRDWAGPSGSANRRNAAMA